jgi:hypothetical protein
MVWEERFFAELKDIISIRLMCMKCQSATTLPFGQGQYVPETCPICHEGWLHSGSSDHQKVVQLLQSLNALRDRNEKAMCKIHIELPGHLNMPNHSK